MASRTLKDRVEHGLQPDVQSALGAPLTAEGFSHHICASFREDFLSVIAGMKVPDTFWKHLDEDDVCRRIYYATLRMREISYWSASAAIKRFLDESAQTDSAAHDI